MRILNIMPRTSTKLCAHKFGFWLNVMKKRAERIIYMANLQVSTVFFASFCGTPTGKPYLAANSALGSRNASGMSWSGRL
jgi:hypothetical protein